MFCNKCGKELPDDAEFCVECGIRIVRREPGKAQIKAVKKARIKAPAETSKEAPVGSVESVEPMESGLKKKSNGAKWWIFGGVAALVVVAALLAVVLGGKGKLFGGQDGLTEEVATDPGEVQTDGSGETAGVGDAAGSGDARTDGSEEMTNLSLCFQEVIYKAGLADARVFLTVGYDNPDGEIVAELTTQADGTVQTELAAGEYTLCWEAGGYYSGHENLTVNGAEISVVKHMLPVLTEQKAYVLIEWDSDRDLDLCVFNAQTNQYINITSAVDDEGNFLYFDNSGADGYELIYLSDYTAGIYTVYVRDDASLLQETSSSMEAEGLTVSIYTAGGLLYRERASAAETAALWSPVYLYQGEAVRLGGSDCYIYDMTNYAWAVCDKGEAVVANSESYNTTAEGFASDSWKDVYIDYIQGIRLYDEYYYNYDFYLLNIDGDDIPELFVDTSMYASGQYVCTYDGRQMNKIQLAWGGISYIPGESIFLSGYGKQGLYGDTVYRIVNGQFVECESGNYTEDYEEYEDDWYRWNGQEVDKTTYDEMLNGVFDTSKAIHHYDCEAINYSMIVEKITSY